MTLLWIYLTLGLCVLPIMAFESRKNPTAVWHACLRDKVLNFLFSFLMTLIMYLLWPMYLGLWLNKRWQDAHPKPIIPAPVFAVTAADLGRAFSRTEIEARHLIDDPMGAVPHVPFGHLNAVWLGFVDQLEGSETLYAFEARWKEYSRWTQLRSGYVAVKGDAIGPFCITEIIDVPNGE